ncbi:MAG: FtsX-like permease family protein [Verrucomicrobia bacterium]|nr:FtsX-like permease family protein [Verrucomicrobiota bacterium]
MIRRRDQIRLSVRKIGLRRKRAVFSIISVALGILVVVTVNSLVSGIRDLVIRTGFTEEIDKDVIRVTHTPRHYGDEESSSSRKRAQFLSDELLAEFCEWKEVEAAAPEIRIQPVNVEALAESPRAASHDYAMGAPEALICRYADARELAACEGVIPLVLGERFVKLRYHERTSKFELEDPARVQSWIGRDVTLRVGDPMGQLERFRYDYDKKQWLRLSEEEIAQRRKHIESYEGEFDKMIHNRLLTLKGRVVGFCPGTRLLMPEEPARLCAKWLKQRNDLARLRPVEPPAEYGPHGRRAPREGEFTRATVLLKAGTNPEPVVKRLKEMGFGATTRQNAFESFLKEVDTAMKIVKRIGYAFGGVLLLLACGLLWSTTSRIVSDSRADIGLFRALGATKGDVRRLFLTETVFLGALGTLVGIFLGWTAAYWISRLVLHIAAGEISDPEEMLMIPRSLFSVDWTRCALLLAGAAAVSLLAGLWPANRAANVDPVKALKRE